MQSTGLGSGNQAGRVLRHRWMRRTWRPRWIDSHSLHTRSKRGLTPSSRRPRWCVSHNRVYRSSGLTHCAHGSVYPQADKRKQLAARRPAKRSKRDVEASAAEQDELFRAAALKHGFALWDGADAGDGDSPDD